MLNMVGRTRTKKFLSFAAVLSLVILIVAGLCYPGSRRRAVLHQAGAIVGDPAPDFLLSDMYGRQLSLSQFRGQKVLLAFWASWCPPCQTEMVSLQRLHENLSVRNLKVLAVNVGETEGQVAAFVARQQLSLPILFDAEGAVQRRYGVHQLPIVFLVDGQGRIIARHLGLRDWSSSEVIDELNRMGEND